MKPIDDAWLDTHEWMLRSSNNGVSHNGFRWKRKGAWTKAATFLANGHCGDGLHGEAPEAHGFEFLYTTLELCETRGPRDVIEGNKIKVAEARIVARGPEIPERAFALCNYQIAHDGDTISPRNGEWWIVLKGKVTIEHQQGGDCWAYGNATLNAEHQQGGDCGAYGNATLNAEHQQGGDCRACGNATLNAEHQQGGYCWACDSATLNAEHQQGGDCWACGNATLNQVS